MCGASFPIAPLTLHQVPPSQSPYRPPVSSVPSSIDGQLLAERVRISRSYERPQSPPVGIPRSAPPPAAKRDIREIPAGRRATPRPVAALPRVPQRDGLDWAALEQCESSGDPRAVSPSGTYRGLHQFDLQTWRSVGGTGDPIDASPAEQRKRAWMLYLQRGRTPWPICGRLL